MTTSSGPAEADEQRDLFGDDARVKDLLNSGGTWAIVGLSSNHARAAYGVAAMLQGKGIRIVPVHPHSETVHGESGYPDLPTAAAAVGAIDVVDIFVRSDLAGDVIDQAVEIGARAVWTQLGVVDEAAARRARAAGLLTVMDRCPAQEWPRLLGVVPAVPPGDACPWVPPAR
ncbi:MAG: CoA-binding protein [Candidatus Nanopelagicales bacterium]